MAPSRATMAWPRSDFRLTMVSSSRKLAQHEGRHEAGDGYEAREVVRMLVGLGNHRVGEHGEDRASRRRCRGGDHLLRRRAEDRIARAGGCCARERDYRPDAEYVRGAASG